MPFYIWAIFPAVLAVLGVVILLFGLRKAQGGDRTKRVDALRPPARGYFLAGTALVVVALVVVFLWPGSG